MKIKLLEAFELPELYEIIIKPEIAKNICTNPYTLTANNLGSYLLRTEYESKAEAFAIYLGETLIGCMTLNNISPYKNSAFLGVIAIDQSRVKEKNPMLGIKAGRWVLRYCFEVLNLNRVYGHTWSDNKRMNAFYRKIGATLEGTEREHTWKQGKYVDMRIWSILRSEWEGAKNGSKRS